MTDSEYALERLKSLQGEINDHIAEHLRDSSDFWDETLTEQGQEAFEKIREFSARPGKRVRGALAVVGYEMFGGTNRKTALDLALAVELIQNYLLIVDDVMDRSPTRRGGKTVHEQYIDYLRDDHNHDDATHIGNMLGVNAGLIAQHMASDVMARLDEKPEHVIKAMSIFHRNIAITGYGQIEDLFNEATGVLEEDAIHTVHMLKNSYYTFINPLQLGAALAGVNGDELKRIYDFGIPAGVAFQLRDDIIGLFGKEEATGKSSLDDLKEGKLTLMMHQALTKGTDAQIQEVRAALGNEDVTEEQHARVKEIVEEVGGLEYTQNKAQEEADAALAVVADSDWPEDDKRFISGLVHYIVKRDN